MATVSERRVMGKRVPKVGAEEMVTGRAAYGADIHLPGMLYAKVLRSPHAHATIRRIDASRALALEGVKAVVTAADMPETAPGTTFNMGEVPVELASISTLVMAQNKALFHGHPIAAVAATDPYIAQDALKLIEVEYEVLPPVLDVLDAIKPDSPLLDSTLLTKDILGSVMAEKPSNIAMHAHIERGDVETAFARSDVVIEHEYRIAMAHQTYIEPQATTAQWGPDGKLTVWTSTQGIYTVQLQLAGLFQMPLSQIKVIPMEVGGAFGGKIYVIIEPVVALLAKKSGHPVKMVLTREEVLRATGPGSPGVIRVKTACNKDGTITAMQVWMAFDAGAIPGSPVRQGMQTGPAPYSKVANLVLDGLDVVTNKPRVHAYRAPGAPQAAFAIEQNIDIMAQAIAMDPLEFRFKNCPQEGDLQVTGVPWNRIGLRQVLERIKAHPHWTSKLEGRNRGRGLGLGFWFGGQLTSSATVAINRDGTVSLLEGSVDITGTRTTMLQIVAEELGLDPQDVHVTVPDTSSGLYADVSGGSRTTYTTGAAVHRACQDAIAKLTRRAVRRFNVSEEEIIFEGGRFHVKGLPEKSAVLKDLAMDRDGIVIGSGSVSGLQQAPSFAAHLADVEVDPTTGKVKILRYTTFQDVGLAINPTRVEAQMQGGAVQGMGWGLTEEYVYDNKAVLRNASLLDYRLLTALDLPMIEAEIIEVPASDGPYGVRGVGEVPIVPPAATLANAIARATGVRVCDMPMTPERVFWALKEASKAQGKGTQAAS